MRKSFLTTVMMLLALGLSAQPISEQEALEKACQFLQGKNFVSPGKNITRSGQEENPFKHLYLFNVENNGGFVIVAGDSRAREILAYSDKGHLDYSQMPDNMRWWLSTYDKAIASIPADMKVTQTRAGQESKPDVAPMMTFSWHQNSPFNKYCPSGCLAGCVPLAMAQMMAYHKYPTSLPALDGYTDGNGTALPALPANGMDYSNLTDEYAAILVRYCGQAVQADYGTDATSASGLNIPSMLVNKFGFDQGVHNVYRNAYSAGDWDDILYKDLSEGRPFILSGQVGNDQSNGHTFICHGYSSGYYAVNWGWGGLENGYFAMDALVTSTGDYSTDLKACVGIRPPAGGTAFTPFSLTKLMATGDTQINREPLYSSFSVPLTWVFYNSLLKATEYDFALALIRPDGKVDNVGNFKTNTYKPENFYNGSAFITIGSQYVDGTYKITLIYKTPSEDTWHFCEGVNWRYVQAVIIGNTLTLTNYPLSDDPYTTGTPPDNPDTPDTPEINWPSSNVTIDFPLIKVDYEGGAITLFKDWNEISDNVQSKLGLTMSAFNDYYWADCYSDKNKVAVSAEDASYVTPYAYNYNNYQDLGMNMYDMGLFNFGTDTYGNGGTPPETGDSEAEQQADYVVLFCPNLNAYGTTYHYISFQIFSDYAKSLTEGQSSPLNFTRWVRFVAKNDANGNVAAPYRFVYVKIPLEISWSGSSDGISHVEANKSNGIYYNLNGQRLSQPRKGINIIGGKKILVK